ncbi:hypothetical protein [Candidatus Allofournierella excrementavium]|uniref:hypothetical protein n=1 Tax=Candidatus Allofournierella excrementavium TaxID=2838591 RepID=UPI003AB307EE
MPDGYKTYCRIVIDIPGELYLRRICMKNILADIEKLLNDNNLPFTIQEDLGKTYPVASSGFLNKK